MSAPRKVKPPAVHLPLGCDSETTSTLDTEHGPVTIRTRRFRHLAHIGGRAHSVPVQRYEVGVLTPRTRADGRGFVEIGDADEIAPALGISADVADHGTAHLVAAEYVRRAAALRSAAADRPPASPDRASSPGRGGSSDGAPSRPSTPRRVPPAKTSAEALRRKLRARTGLWEQCTGELADDAYRAALRRATDGRTDSSKQATRDELGAAVEAVENELVALGYGPAMTAADAAYTQRQAARVQHAP